MAGEYPFVSIGNREIFDTLNDVSKRLQTVEEKLDNYSTQNEKIKSEYGNRIRQLELRSYTLLAGCLSAVGLALKTGIL